MFKCDEFIYVQIPKTACSHIARLLDQLFDGKMIGKHNAPTLEEVLSTPRLIASIRNPWDWYISLWAFGVQGRGALMERLTKRNLLNLSKAIFSCSLSHRYLIYALTRDIKQWLDVYTNEYDVKAFRRWLQLLHAPDNWRALGEGYANTILPEMCGFMTYRYLYLCCSHLELLQAPNSLKDFQQLSHFDRKYCYIDFFIRQETLEETLCQAIEHIKPLSPEQKQMIFNAGKTKTNASLRPLPVNAYYDQESIDLIGNRERLIIEKFNYSPPI